MAREKDIPSYLDIGGVKTFIKYPDQPSTCRSCNVIGHKVQDCPALKASREERRVVEKAMVQNIESFAGGGRGNPPTPVPEVEENSNGGPAAEQGNNNGETVNNQVEDIAPASTETFPLAADDVSTSSQVLVEVETEIRRILPSLTSSLQQSTAMTHRKVYLFSTLYLNTTSLHLVSPTLSSYLILPFSVLEKMVNHKAPGGDGILYEFYVR